MIFFIGSMYSTTQYIVIRVLAIISALLSKLLISASKINSHTALYTGFYNMPITFSAMILFTLSYPIGFFLSAWFHTE